MLLLNRIIDADTAPTARLMHDVARHFRAAGWRVTTPGWGRAWPVPGMDLIGRLLHLPVLLWLGWRSGRDRRPDLVVSLSDPPMVLLVAVLLGRWWRVPVVYWCHDVFPEALRVWRAPSWLMTPLMRNMARLHGWCLGQCRQVVVPGADLAEALRDYRPDCRITVMPNWPDAVVAASPRPGRRDDGLSLLYSGNYGRTHDLIGLIRAAGLLDAEGVDLRIRLALRPEGARRLWRQWGARALPGNVGIEPLVPHDRLLQHLASADIHLAAVHPWASRAIVPCKTEAAWRVGRPVLLLGDADSALAHDITDRQVGWVVAADDVAGIADWLRQLSRDPARVEAAAVRAARFGDERRAADPMIGLARVLEQAACPAVLPHWSLPAPGTHAVAGRSDDHG